MNIIQINRVVLMILKFFSESTNPLNQLRTINFTFHITYVVRQKDWNFKDILSLIGNMA